MSYSTVLVPIAPDYGDEALRAMQVARSLLSPDGTITVVTVLEEPPSYMAAEAYLLQPTREELEQAITTRLVDDFSAPDVTVLTRAGHAARTILDLAKERGHDCIVIASAQPGWETFLLGSTASGVVRHARCSVHVLRGQDTADPF